MSNFNNSFGYGSAATARPQPPPRRRANSIGYPSSGTPIMSQNSRPPRRSLAERPVVSHCAEKIIIYVNIYRFNYNFKTN